MKDLSRLRLANPKHSATWDLQVLLSHLESLPLQLSLQLLSQELVSLLVLGENPLCNVWSNAVDTNLLVLVRGERLQTISLIMSRLSNIMEDEQWNPNQYLIQAYFTSFFLFDSLTKPNEDFLFLTFRKLVGNVSKQTLSRWVKQMLFTGGTDVSRCKPHMMSANTIESSLLEKTKFVFVLSRSRRSMANSQN